MLKEVIIASFLLPSRQLRTSLDYLCFQHFQIVKVLNAFQDSGACLRGLLVFRLRAVPNVCYGLHFNEPGYTLSVSLKSEDRYIQI